jgi:hypothetical protein
VAGVDGLGDLVSEQLEREDGLFRIDRAAVHKQPGGLVDCHQVIITIQDTKVSFGQIHSDKKKIS